MKPNTQILEVWGEMACFSRPEMKVERFSYPVITPAAARGVFDAIYAKPPEFRWQIDRIDVLSPPAYIALRRNEVKGKASSAEAAKWARGTADPVPLMADADDEATGRTQRQTMALRNVHYRIYAHIEPWPEFRWRQTAFEEQFQRRASKGKCFYQPYFGCREFPAYFEPVTPERSTTAPVPLDLDVGLMLYDVFDLRRPGRPDDPPFITLFRAQIRSGTMQVPPFEDEAVIKLPGGTL